MKRMGMSGSGLFVGLLLGFLFLFSAVSFADEASIPVLKTKIKTVAVFKNGLGFFVREGQISVNKDGWAMTETVPDAALGTLWMKADGLEESVAFKEEKEKEEETKVTTVEELLEANAGKEAKITLDEKTFTGKIRPFPEDKPASFVILDMEKSAAVLKVSQIKDIEFLEAYSTKTTTKKKEIVKKIKFRVSKSGRVKNETTVNFYYLQKGISWIPGYLVDIKDPKKAKIAMQAIVINDVEDLEEADIYFVVGYPNFMYADILSPMNLTESLSQFLSSVERGGSRPSTGITSNILTQRAVVYEEGPRAPSQRPREEVFDFSAATKTPGVSEEDLFLYHKDGVSLKKGERACYDIFSGEVNYRHIYQLDVPNTINVDSRVKYLSAGKVGAQVWHSLKLDNSTAYPWTTAPALVVSGEKPLAQDTINYTPKGTESNLKITVATDVKADYHEYEEERQRDVKIRQDNYDLVTVKGEIYLKNFKSKDINTEIKKTITGEVAEAGYEGKINKVAEGITGVNPSSLVSWEIPLKAGEEITIYYRYKVYVR